jgi:hypothetical protein
VFALIIYVVSLPACGENNLEALSTEMHTLICKEELAKETLTRKDTARAYEIAGIFADEVNKNEMLKQSGEPNKSEELKRLYDKGSDISTCK